MDTDHVTEQGLESEDQPILVGGPGSPVQEGHSGEAEGSESGSAALRKINLGGREFEVPEDLAEVLEDRDFDVTQRLSKGVDELTELRKKVELLEKGYHTAPVDPFKLSTDYSEMIHTDPNKALQSFGHELLNTINAEIDKKLNPVVEEVKSTRYEEGLNRFWADFFSEHEDLKPARKLANTLLMENQQAWGSWPISRVQSQLAKLTRATIAEMTGQPARLAPKGTHTDSGRSRSKPVTNKPAQPATMSDLLRERRAKRMGRELETKKE